MKLKMLKIYLIIQLLLLDSDLAALPCSSLLTIFGDELLYYLLKWFSRVVDNIFLRKLLRLFSLSMEPIIDRVAHISLASPASFSAR